MFVLEKNYRPLKRLTAWDEVTRQLIEDRINNEIGDKLKFVFLSAEEGDLLQIIASVLLGQNAGNFRIKIAEAIDKGLSDQRQGVNFTENLWPGELYKRGLSDFRQRFSIVTELNLQDVQKIVSEILSNENELFLAGFLRRVLHDSAGIYYSHPDSWSQVGFPGPAFPEGYAFLNCDQKEEWEPNFKEA